MTRGENPGGTFRAATAACAALCLAFAAVFAGEGESCGPPGPETTPAYLKDLKHGDPGRRMRAAFLLGRMGADEALPALLDGMKDKHLHVRLLCGEAVAKIERGAFAEELAAFAPQAVETLLRGENIGARPHAAAFLGAARIEGTQIALLSAVRDRKNQNINVRASSAAALGAFRGEAVTQALVHALSDPHFVVRLSAARALEQIGSAESLEALKKLLNDPEEQVREQASRALEKFAASVPPPGERGENSHVVHR